MSASSRGGSVRRLVDPTELVKLCIDAIVTAIAVHKGVHRLGTEMPYLPHYRLSMEGELRGGAAGTTPLEFFSMRVNLANEGGPLGGSTFNEDALTDYTQDAIDFFARPTSGIGPSAVLTSVKMASIGADGKYVADPLIRACEQPGARGGAALYPFQVSLAVSLTTDRRGASGRGRLYLPSPNIAMDAFKVIAPNDADAVGGSVALLLQSWGNTAGPDTSTVRPVIASLKGFHSTIVGARCGRVYDTIRSRRTSLLEQYGVTGPVS